ncbi:SDR family NAD(P)-dependent oxidoreductase [Mycobacterium sp. ITM-2016-00317]|uniref:SDR family NAD(P)-dependent oxidoreductase n=1 Tax=Mycobacterium sp. ITM-2016-00317 TaxID=2099694 RepID=UPI00287F45E7|nr:SDR family NAD(P)-dependent oxidoreductase [Mycobacterium sp. ITM-2016-00317]WNG87447.1 SDR family NAD(P)-dependent oxidoreductase [Mycobacterium sp. ITM-2016-00317]
MTSRVPVTLLEGRTVIVTGAARGVGKGIASALVERGASVLAVDRDAGLLGETADQLGPSVRPLVADLRERDCARRIVAAAVDAFGTVHGLVNNAIATNEPKPFQDITREDYDLVFDTGPRATFELMQAAYPTLAGNGGGSIVNLGSGSGTLGKPKFGAYAGAKEAIRGISKAAAMEWARDGVRVNVVCPFAESDGVRAWREMAPEAYERSLRSVPMGRLGDVGTDIGPVVCFLLSDESSYVTAQTIMVDGGTAGFR